MSGVLRRGRVAAAALAVALAGMLSSPTTPSAAAATTADESLLLTLTNAARAAVGIPALTLDGPLSSIARRWAVSMGAQNNLSHNLNLKSQIEAAGYTNWTKTGENVGMGPTVQAIHNALLASPGHYRNITDAGFQRVGIGIAVTNGTVWVVVDFLAVSTAATEPPTKPPPATTSTTTAPPPPPSTATTATTTTTTTTTTTVPATTVPPAPTPSTTLPPPSSGLPLQLALMLQQLKGLSAPR